MAKSSVNIDAQCAKILSEVRAGRFSPVYLLMGDEPYYPIDTAESRALLARYMEEAAKLPGLVVGGRLGGYKYYDIDKSVEAALSLRLLGQ